MSRHELPLAACLLLTLFACDAAPVDRTTTLAPDPNPMGQGDPLWSPQPDRDRPRALCTSGDKAWVMLGGTEDAPGDSVAVVDLAARRVLRRVKVGRSPWACALDPTGRWLVVTLRYSDRAVVLDARTDAEVARVPVPFYTESALFSARGDRVFLANRWKDSVLAWDVDLSDGFEVVRTSYDGVPFYDPMGTPVGDNPAPMALSTDGTRLFVGAVAGLTIAVLDARTLALVDADGDPATTTRGAPPGITHLDLRSPVGGLAVSDRWLFVTDTGRGTGSQPARGSDLDDDGAPGDHTANVVFQDVQNEIGVIDTTTLREVHRYTSDTICCRDYRDVDPDRPSRGLAIPAPDTWAPDVLRWLPPRETWIVAGALPEAMVVDAGALWVAYPGSNEVQGFTIGADGSLSPRQVAGGLLRTGFNPKAIVVTGGRVVTANRLGESLTVFAPGAGSADGLPIVVGDVSGGAFPATDAEIGEAINEMTAAFTVDGDQTCVHCHRDNGAIARAVVMPLQADRVWGSRNIMAQRGLYDTRPWFFESAMAEDNFFPVLNEFARKENFCCEQLDPTVWPAYPDFGTCRAAPSTPGCDAVLDCEASPPPECAARPYPVPSLRRSTFMREGALRLLGRDMTFGDAVYEVALDGSRRPRPLDFEGVTRAIGVFMLRTPRLLPNPNRFLDLPSARRGRVLFEDAAVGCGLCHPLPNTTTANQPVLFSPAGMPVRFPPVLSPTRAPDGSDASRVTPGFIQTFPQTAQGPEGLRVGATPLRGLWDRPKTRLLHDGRARSLREALATPGHPALRPGEVGHNERDGVFDTHGGTSQLDRYQLEDLMNFLLSL